MTDLVERLRNPDNALLMLEAADEIDRLRTAMESGNYLTENDKLSLAIERQALEIKALRESLQAITDHFADVMDGPMIRGAGIEFKNGVDSIPTIAKARSLLKEVD